MKDFEYQADLDNNHNHCAVYGFMYVYTQVHIYQVQKALS